MRELKPYTVIDCPEQSIISNKVIEYLKIHSDFFKDQSFELWNKIDTVSLSKAVPEIGFFFKKIGLALREISITVINKHQDVGLHIDELPVTAKINFPILNTQNTFNEWYDVPEHLLKTVNPIINKFGSAFYDLHSIDLTQCSKIGEYELIKPVVFNSQIPHTIRITEQTKFPRIVMPCTFFKEPIHLLYK